MWYFCRKYIMFGPKRGEKLCLITLRNHAKFEEELTCALKNDMGNFANFDTAFESLKICALMGFFLPNYIMFQLKNYRGIMCHDNEG